MNTAHDRADAAFVWNLGPFSRCFARSFAAPLLPNFHPVQGGGVFFVVNYIARKTRRGGTGIEKSFEKNLGVNVGLTGNRHDLAA
jgi:hypothetical protein